MAIKLPLRNSPMQGMVHLLEGIALLRQPVLRRFVLIPLLINILLFSLGLWYAYEQLAGLLAWLNESLPSWLNWLSTLIIPLFMLAATMVIFSTFTLIANLIAAPFNSLLAERVERFLTGQPLPSLAWDRFLLSIPGALWDEVKKVLYQLMLALPCLILFLVPGVNILAPFLWAVLSSWLLALGYMDFPMGNHGLSGSRMRELLRARLLTTMGFGGGVMVMTLIPVVNFLAMPAAVAGAAAYWAKEILPAREQP